MSPRQDQTMAHEHTRRAWLQMTAAGLLPLAHAARAAAQGTEAQPYGVQLYTLRNQMATQPEQTLEAVARIGYREIEVLRADMAKTVAIGKRLGLSAPAAHIEAPIVTGNWQPWRLAAQASPMNLPANDAYDMARAADDLRAQGVKYAVVAYLMPGERNAPGFYERFADQMNRAGETARRAGLTLCYHNHGFEFERQPDGRTPFDILVERLDPALVQFEIDVFWVAITGLDPAALIERHAKRISLLHLKDTAPSAERATDEARVPPQAFAEVGRGTIDFAKVLAAGRAAGVAHYFVEQDHTPGDPIASLEISFGNLQKLAARG
jgi:sugar phosphate isomerase/epimerase